MKAFAVATLALLERSGVTHGDVRVVSRRTEQLHVKNGQLDAWSDEEEQGFGVRVLRHGFWGFASSNELTEREAGRTVERALEVAAASAVVGGGKAQLAPQEAFQGDHTAPCAEDPFALSSDEKIAYLLEATADLAAPGVTLTLGSLGASRQTTVFASTEGSPPLADAHRGGRRHLRHRRAGRRRAESLLPLRPRRELAAGRLRGGAPDESPRARPAPGRGGGRPARRPLLSGRDGHHHPGQRPGGAAGPRVGGPPHRARPHPGVRDQLRRHQLPARAGPGSPALRLGARHHRGRRHPARRPGHLRLRRRRRARPAGTAGGTGRPARLPHLPGDRRHPGTALRRCHARLRLEHHPADPHDQHQPGARASGPWRTSSPTPTTAS